MNLVNLFKFRIFKGNIKVYRLIRLGKFQIELCIFPANIVVDWHKHDLSDIEVMLIKGYAYFHRADPSDVTFKKEIDILVDTRAGDRFRMYSVPRSYWHKAVIGNKGLITLSIQRWRKKTLLITEDYTEPKL